MNRRRSTSLVGSLSEGPPRKGGGPLQSRLEPSFPGKMVPLHFHHGDEFHLVLSGEWAAQVEGKPYHIMKSDDAQYVEREHAHGC
jgi:mannose-6-phosphate isomerase-like protein (cupin superfamily)